MTLEQKDISFDGLTTRYYEGGPADAPPVLLVHDGSYGADALLSFGEVARLLSSNHRVVLPDLYGWGGSSKGHWFDQSLYAPRIRQLAQLSERLGLDGAHAVGNSFGGSLVLHTAISGAVPLASATSIAGTGGPWRSQLGMTAMTDYQSTREEAERVSALVVSSDRADDAHIERRYQNSLIPGHWESLRAWGLRNPVLEGGAPASDYPASLSRVSIPVLLIEGDADVMVEPGWSERVVEAAPNVRRQVLSAGHSPNIDQPEAVADLLSEFFAESSR